MKRVQSFKSVREEEVHALIQSISHSCSQAVNLSEMLLCMSNNIICREVFGKGSLMMESAIEVNIMILFRRQEIAEHSWSLYDDHGHEEEDFLDVLLKLQKDSSLGFFITKDHIKAILMNMFLGGTDTSASTLEWAMSKLMRYLESMKKAQDEVRGVVGS
ncbi:putative costunolide synthase [Dioscorea sansibarensis]